MKWKHLYNKLGLSSQITSASYSLKMAYKKHLFPFEEHQRTNNDKDSDIVADDGASPMIKPHDQQSGDEECGSTASTKSLSADHEADQGPPADDDDDDDNTTQEDAMDTTDNNNNNDRYDCFLSVDNYLRGNFDHLREIFNHDLTNVVILCYYK